MSAYDVGLFFHLVGVLTFVSGIVLAGAAFETARRRDDPAGIAVILVLSRIGALLVAAGFVVLLPFGLWLVHQGHYRYTAGWVGAAMGLLLVSMLLGGLAGQRPKQARVLAARLATENSSMTPELRALLDEPLSRAVNIVSALLIVAIVALMVFKP